MWALIRQPTADAGSYADRRCGRCRQPQSRKPSANRSRGFFFFLGMDESSVVSDVTTTDASEMFYDARESPADDLSASFKRDHINSGKSPPPVVSQGWMSGNPLQDGQSAEIVVVR